MKLRHEEIIRKMTLKENCQILSGKTTWTTHEVAGAGVPAMFLSDGPSGLRRQAGAGDHLGLNASTKATCIPSAATIANSWDPEVARAMGSVVGADARAQSVQIVLGPGLNTKRSSLCGRSFEYYSEDPYLAGKLAAGFIQGVQENEVSACAKHFAVNSQELLRMHSDSVMDERTLRELYLTNFEIAIDEGKPHCVMTSYNKLNGTYTNENTHLYEILRGEWGYDGMVVTDWGGSNSYVEGVRAGMNLEMPAAGDDSALQLMQAVRQGTISEDVVNERVDQLLDVVLMTTAVKPSEPVDSEAQHEKARAAAEKCIVLLKNEGALLPLGRDAKVAIIGDFAGNQRYQGAGSSMVNAFRVDEPLPLLREAFPNMVGYAQGFERLDRENEKLAAEAEALAKKADVVLLYIGLPEGFETEGLDRTHMRLPQNQVALIERLSKVNANIVATLSCGSAVEMPWISQVRALLYGGLGGEAAAQAMVRVLSGDVCPGGKLAETFPVEYEKTPVSQYYPGEEATSEYREGIYVGYRYFETAKEPVRFPFGFGLSYTTFEYNNLSVSQDGVTFEVTNTGDRAGDEIAQLYVGLPGAKIFRPAIELKGFRRVHLEKGETRKVTIPFDRYTFRYFNVQSGAFEVEGGQYDLWIGASCEDIRLRATWQVKGTGKQNPYASMPVDCYRNCQLMDVPDTAFQAILGHRIPRHNWDKSKPLDMNDTVRQLQYAKNPVARLAYRILTGRVNKAIQNGKPDLNLLFIYNIPFRGMAKMMGGMVTNEMAEDIVFLCNGHWHRGIGRLIKHYLHRPKLEDAK
ncbi:MAG: glycoside hydrolase family 3 C-terminal domain-containing protein [Clostridia bacterium]|nr:glycoside hydrolase family 3 C-terminal domain-containing protein [Clostridia bacterium]